MTASAPTPPSAAAPPRPKRKRRMVWITLLLIYLAVLAFGKLGDRFILFPRTEPPEPNGAARQFIPFNGGKLEIYTANSPGVSPTTPPEAYVLRFWGNGDRADWHVSQEAQTFHQRPVQEWGVNYPGYGQSTGPATLSSIAPAADAAYNALAKVANGKPVLVFGSSLGTTPALHLAATRKVAALLLANPPPLPQLVRSPAHGWWNLWLFALPVSWSIPQDLNSIRNAANCSAPAVFVLSENDEVVPPYYHHLITNAYAGPKTVIVMNNATHNTPWDLPTAQRVNAALATMWPNPLAQKHPVQPGNGPG